ncbi:MAG: hypothetical protein IPO99_10310 [Nitrospira sp.]|nr:hypothetical protein [Nitrospira sp.]
MSHAVNADSHTAQDAAPASVSQPLVEQRQAIRQRLLAGASGDEVVTATTDMVDGLIVGRYRTAARTGGEALTTAGFQHCCLRRSAGMAGGNWRRTPIST